MEIDITALADPNEHDLMSYSASCAELGQDAGSITWNNCLDADLTFLRCEEERQDTRDYFRSFGAWSRDEIEAWTDKELNAVLLQDIASNLREYLKAKDGPNFDRWNENFGGCIYENNGKFYFYLGN